MVGTELPVALEVAAAATGAAKATGLATRGWGCATAETGALFTGLLWRPIA